MIFGAMTAPYAGAQSVSDIFGRLGKSGENTSSSSGGTSSETSESKGGGLGEALGSMLGSMIATDKFNVEELIGTWNYKSPAVGFASDNALKKIGGAAASTALESKLEPYYKQVGLNSVKLTVDKDLKFTMAIKGIKLTGTISKDENNQLVFAFGMGKMKLANVKAIARKAGKKLDIVFDATKLMTVLDAVSKVAKLQSLTALNSLLQQYDGLYLGFKMEAEASKK